MEIDNLEINNNERLVKSLRKNLRKSSYQQRHNSYSGAIEHVTYIAAILGLMKLGLYPTAEKQQRNL